MKNYKKRLFQIYSKIDSVSKGGEDNRQVYYELIDELIKNSEYEHLSDVMITKYDINIDSFIDINDFKIKSYEKIRYNTIPNDLIALKRLFNSLGVYQVGLQFYNDVDNLFLGTILENDQSLIVTRSNGENTEIVDGTIIEKYNSAIEYLRSII